MDVLSEVLKSVRLDGALFYNAEFSAPWCFRAPASHSVAPYVTSGSRHVIIFHLLTEGHSYAHIDNRGPSVPLQAGDLVIVPHGDPHILGNGLPVTSIDSEQQLQRMLFQGLTLSRMGGGGEVARFICGYMACDRQLSQIFLGGLPPIFKVSIRADVSGQWLEQTIRYSVDHADVSIPGGAVLRAKLAEILFIETLRRYITQLAPEQTGWLAGIRDPEVGKALGLLHRKPDQPWTIASLSREVGISRSVLAERFRRFLSAGPMAYLTRWRLQLGAQLLQTTSHSVAQIANDVGYESESSFNRAFKREFDLPPARFRSLSKSTRNTAILPVSAKSWRGAK